MKLNTTRGTGAPLIINRLSPEQYLSVCQTTNNINVHNCARRAVHVCRVRIALVSRTSALVYISNVNCCTNNPTGTGYGHLRTHTARVNETIVHSPSNSCFSISRNFLRPYMRVVRPRFAVYGYRAECTFFYAQSKCRHSCEKTQLFTSNVHRYDFRREPKFGIFPQRFIRFRSSVSIAKTNRNDFGFHTFQKFQYSFRHALGHFFLAGEPPKLEANYLKCLFIFYFLLKYPIGNTKMDTEKVIRILLVSI